MGTFPSRWTPQPFADEVPGTLTWVAGRATIRGTTRREARGARALRRASGPDPVYKAGGHHGIHSDSGWRAPEGVSRALVLVAALAAAALGLVACGGSASSGSATAGGQTSGAAGGGASDSFTAAWPKAADAVKAVAGDAVLVAAGTTGLAFADVPETWSFTYLSHEKGSVYTVVVEHGKAGTPRTLGTANKDVVVKNAVDVGGIKVGAGQSVVRARAFGEKTGTVPKNVVVGGVFAELPGGAEADYKTGVWTVVFATGTDLADAQTFAVDMMTGEVTSVKSD